METRSIIVLIGHLVSLIAANQVFGQSSPAAIPHPWFRVDNVRDGVWRISEGDIDNIYLIAGSDSAMLIDTGLGVANLRDFVSRITPLPLIVVNTHAHLDHTGGSFQFPKVYAHPDDFDMIRFFGKKQFRKYTIGNLRKVNIPDSVKFPVSDSLFNVFLLPVHDGQMFDLGDRKIEVIHTPGHTAGSICLLDHKDSVLYSGDTNNGLAWLHTPDALPLEVYMQSLEKLLNRTEFHTLYPGHDLPYDRGFIKEQIECVRQIIAGECVGVPYDTLAGARVCGYGRARIAYDPEKIAVSSR
jgi:glyoxylase-like metal-dependent hydrolase (beta-lactamase superfamily II)